MQYTAEEILIEARIHAAKLYTYHLEKDHDLNPYSTAGARGEFQRGFDNMPARSWENPDHSLNYRFQLGRAVALLCAEKGLTCTNELNNTLGVKE